MLRLNLNLRRNWVLGYWRVLDGWRVLDDWRRVLDYYYLHGNKVKE